MKKTILSALLLLISAIAVQAQNVTVNGTVISAADNEPLIGASIVSDVAGSVGTATDIDGKFTITVPEGSTLKFSYVGFRTEALKAEPQMEVYLQENSELLDEVVVVGYQTVRKADLTGAVSVVSTKTLETSSDTDPMRALQGKVPGMTITADGSPSGTGSVRIRGIGSFNASQDPLFVIDGVPTTATLNSLNMNDIESMQVLKDAASASIYGSRAANGVIIITTKRGKAAAGESKVNVSFSANLTAQFYTSQSTMKLLDTPGYATAMAQAALNDGLDPVAYASGYGLDLNAASGFPISVYDIASGRYVNYTVNGHYDGFINAKRTMAMSDTDWLDEISRTGFSQSYDAAVSTATDRATAFFSLGYRKNDGILRYTSFENISARINSSFNISPVVSVGENFTLTYTDQVDCHPMENALKMPSIVPVFETDGVTYAGPVGSMADRQNPLRELAFNRDNALNIWRLFGNAYIDIKPFKGLVLRSNFGLDYDAAFIHSYNYTFHSDIVNNDTNSTTLSQANDSKWTWSNTANYNFSIKDHSFTVLAGMELFRQSRIDFSGYNENYDIETPEYMYPDASSGVERSTGNKSAYALVSFFGKVDYNWRNLLLASFTIRRDGSSRFGRNNRYGTFPAATLGYRISENLKAQWLNDLKLRLSWGKTGNQAISNTARYALYVADYGNDRVTSTAYDLLLQQSGVFPSGYLANQTANDNLKWETTIQYNAGVDYSMLNDRLYGTVDAYIKDVKDMLITPAYLGSMGEGGASWLNGPSLRNWGMEFLIGWRDRLSCGLDYRATLNFDFFRNHVTYLPSTTTGSYAHTTTENLVQSHQPYGSIVGYMFDGIFQNQAEVDASGQDNARVGGMRYADLDNNGRITPDDQTWIFNPVPDLSFGLNVEMSYRNFDFQMFWQGIIGQDVYNNQKFQNDFWSVTDAGSNKGVRVLDAWLPDVNTSSTIPMLTTNNTGDEGRTSSYFVENGSYAKLRSLQIGYSLPSKVLDKLRMSKARVYVSGQNLATIKSKSLTCSDPENANWAYPIPTSLSFGLQLEF